MKAISNSEGSSMSLWKIAIRSLTHFWRTNLALLLGIAIGTAVLTGALVVGDSVRGSLQALTIERLGKIAEILIGEQFFREELAQSLETTGYRDVVPAILINQVTVEHQTQQLTSRSQGVTLVGMTESFWQLNARGPQPATPGPNQIVVNQALADELEVQVGDRLLLRVGKTTGLAADSPLARKNDLVKTMVDLELIEIVSTTGLGRFSLQASQQLPLNAFVALETLQEGLDQPEKINAVLVASEDPAAAPSEATFTALQKSLAPTLEDLGLSLERVRLSYQGADGTTESVSEYDTLTNVRMIFDSENDQGVSPVVTSPQAQPVFTYLATKLQKVDEQGVGTGDIVPYSTISALDSVAELGPILQQDGSPIVLEDDGIVINSWAADDLQAAVGDRIRVTYFEPETAHGTPEEQSAEFQIRAIAKIQTPFRPFSRRRAAVYDVPPTLANDPHLTPEVEGITDVETINKWDAPFPMDRSLLRGRDDDYWQDFRATPKAFVSLAAGRQLWGSRFGRTTSYRIPITDGISLDARREAFANTLADAENAFGFRWIRAKRDGLAASQGTTPFDALFFGFSMFIIAAALMLVSLLLRLNLEHRASQAGLLGALGFPWRQSLRLFLTENAILAVMGSLLGILLGVGYAWLMLAGLRTLWVQAVVVPFMRLEVTPRAMLIGLAIGMTASLLTIFITLSRLRRVPLSRLMAGKTEDQGHAGFGARKRSRWVRIAPGVLVVLAALLGFVAPGLTPEAQGGAFFGAGACILAALLLTTAAWLSNASEKAGRNQLNLFSLAQRNLARSPTRSVLTLGLVASACFLIIAISAFRLSPTEEGTGGFELVGKSDQPIFSLEQEDAANLDGRIFSMRMQSGDDASCRNLYQSSRPQLIGVPDDFIAEAHTVGQMEWADHIETPDDASSWSILQATDGTDVIPVVLDKNTAMYGMQLYGGVGSEFERDYGEAGILKFRVVGLLSGSIFQGSILVHETQLLRHFPRLSGYRYFLVDTPAGEVTDAKTTLEDRFSDEGLDLVSSRKLLTELLAVQNTYLSTFQSLGGLGLLLGTFGLAAVQLRNVMQRRGELALLRATGYRNGQLSRLVFYEHAMLLFGGLLVGAIAALFVILPHMLFGGATIPMTSLLITLGLVSVTGIASGTVAQRYLQRTPLLPALRGD